MNQITQKIIIIFGLLFWVSGVVAQNTAIDPRTGAPLDWGDPMPEMLNFMVLIDRLELGSAADEDTNTYDLQGWYGGDYHRMWIKAEGEGERGEELEDAEVQLLYGRMMAPFWDAQLGLRHEYAADTSRTSLVLGLQGVVPYDFELDTALFVSEDGNASIRAEFEYEWLLTQRLILQPRLELSAAFDDVPDDGVGSGLNSTELGLRLRYEFKREFAPYIGVSHSRTYGGTANFARAAGKETSSTALVLGIRAWF